MPHPSCCPAAAAFLAAGAAFAAAAFLAAGAAFAAAPSSPPVPAHRG
jgi:hypothetical protein